MGDLFNKIVETVFENIPLNHDPFENPVVLKYFKYLIDKVDMKLYEKQMMKIIATVKMLVLNEIKCGTSKDTMKEVKGYLEMLNTNEPIKMMIEGFVCQMEQRESERFINSINNA